MTGLKIAPGFTFPVDVVTESIAILAKRGAGKTYAASVLVEEMLDAGLQVVVVDPIGAWWGLRSSADGKGAGFPVPILGGEHGDVPLQATGGQVVADLVVDERVSAIVDLSAFSKNDWRRFVADFLARLYQRNREPMHVVLEEADLFAPEGKLKRHGDEQMLGAVYDLVRRGRGKGLGSTLITQRSASISKEVLTQAEILIALRTTGPHDRRAIDEWVRVHAEALDVNALASLPTGEAWVSWPVEGILKRVKIRPRRTFDSSATPKPGQVRRQPKTLADVDLQAFKKRMAETIERAKAEDPRELRRHIAELEKQVRARPTEARVEAEIETVVERVEVQVPVFANGQVMKLEQLVANLAEIGKTLVSVGGGISEALGWAVAERGDRALPVGATRGIALRDWPVGAVARKGPTAAAKHLLPAAKRVTPSGPPRTTTEGDPSKSQQRVLDAVAWLSAIGLEGERVRVGFLAGYRRGGRFNDVVSSCRTAGWIDYPRDGVVELTPAGRALATPTNIPANTDSLQTAVMERLNGSQRRVLTPLIAAYPNALSREALRDASGYGEGGRFNDVVSSVRSLGLIDYLSPGWVVALPVLFLEANA